MTPSSSDPGGVRPARFDRPLQGARPGAGRPGVLGGALISDPQLQRQAEEIAERAREEARAAGYAAGWAQGRQAAAECEARERVQRAERARVEQEAATHRMTDLLAGLAHAVAQADLATVPAWTELADTVADGALVIARAVLAREPATVDAEVAEAVRIAVRSLAAGDAVVVHLNPADHGLVTSMPKATVPDGVRLVSDPQVPSGTVIARTPLQRLWVDLPAAVAAAEEVLRS
jgi:flagellar assembly protein FliH